MLGKVMKYEFLATARQFIPAYIAVMVLAIINGVLLWAGGDRGISQALVTGTGNWAVATNGLLMAFYILMIYSIAILTTVLIIRRFYVSMFKDEGYLTHTLPVSTDTLLFGKLLTAVCWSIISTVVVSISFLIFIGPWISEVWSDMIVLLSFDFGLSGLLIGIPTMLAGVASSYLAFYSALSIGSLAKRRKISLAIGVYMGYGFIAWLVVFIFLLHAGPDVFDALFSHPDTVFDNLMLVMLGISLVYAAIHYFIARAILKNKLNLE